MRLVALRNGVTLRCSRGVSAALHARPSRDSSGVTLALLALHPPALRARPSRDSSLCSHDLLGCLSMEGSVSAPPQRVCPKCARISWATGPRCPYCRARFRRQNIAVIAWMLAVAVLVTLAGMAAILLLVGNHVTDHVNDRADQIERQFNAIQHEIDQRLPAGGVPSVTPVPTPSPSPSPTETPTETPSPSPSASPSATPTATNTPSSDSGSTSDQNRTETRP